MAPRPKKERLLSGFQARVNQLIGQTSYKDFETRCGLKHSIVKNILEGGEPSRDKVEAIIRGTGCNARWLVTGEGEPFGDEKSPPEHSEGHEIPSLSATPHLKAHETAGLLLASVAAILASIGRGDVSPNLGQHVLRQAVDAIRAALQSPPGDEAGFDAVRESLSRASSDS